MPNDNVLSNVLKKKVIDDEVSSIWQTWLRVKEYHQRKLDRSIENWRFYWGLDANKGYGQWPEKAVVEMQRQNRQLLTYNFVKPLVDAIAGGIVQRPYDPEFIPVNEEITSITKAVQKAMYSDKELMDWGSTYLQVVIHGLVHEASMKMVVTNEYHDLGNIGFEMGLPGSTLTDPMWKTWRSKDLRICWKETWYNPEELIKIYPDMTDVIKSEAAHVKRNGPMYGNNTGITPYATEEYSWGTAHRVIEQYEMIEEIVKQEFLITMDGDIPIPGMPDEEKPQWLNQNHPDWQPDYIYEKKIPKKVCIVRAIAPSLVSGRTLEKMPTEVQCGRLPFFFWAASRHNGESHSIVDSVKDPQMNINYWESLLTHKIQVEGGGGAQFGDPAGFKNYEEFLRWTRNRNDPTETFETKPGLITSGGHVPAKAATDNKFPSEVYRHLEHIIQLILPQISKVTPSSLGRTEKGTDTSGYLYRQLREQSDIQTYTIHYGLRMFWNDVYEAYLMQAAETYSLGGVPRSFSINKGREKITLNEEVTLPDGRKGIKNDAKKLREIRHKVIISDKQESPTDRMDNVRTLSEFLQSIAAYAQFKPVTIGLTLNKIVKNLDQFDSEDKEQLEAVGEKELELGMANLELQIAATKAQTAQMGAAAANGGVPPEGGGAPQPGQPALSPQAGGPKQLPGPQAPTTGIGPQAPGGM